MLYIYIGRFLDCQSCNASAPKKHMIAVFFCTWSVFSGLWVQAILAVVRCAPEKFYGVVTLNWLSCSKIIKPTVLIFWTHIRKKNVFCTAYFLWILKMIFIVICRIFCIFLFSMIPCRWTFSNYWQRRYI